MKTKNWKIVAGTNGFYFFGEEVQGADGYITLQNASMFGGFSGGKGLPGVARGDKSAKVTLDKFSDDASIVLPITSTVFIADSVDLYTFSGTELR